MSSNQASQKEIDELDKRLLNERLKLEQLNAQLDQNKKDTDKATSANKSFGDEIRGVASAIGLNISPALEKLAKKFDGISAAVGNAVLGIGAMVAGLISCSKAAAENADELLTLASTTGMTTDEIQKLQYASRFIDVDFNTMTSSITKLEQSMSKARSGSDDVSTAFKKLHVRVTDSRGAFRDQNDVFYEVIDALGKVKNETERDTLAMTLFGRSAKELNPLIQKGSQEMKKLNKEAEELGVVMGEEDLTKLGRLSDAFERFDATTDTLKNNLGLVLLPILTALFEAISSIPEPVLRTLVILAGMITPIVLIVKAIKSLTDTAKTIKEFFGSFDKSSLKTTAIIIGVVVALIALAAIIAVIIGKSDELGNTMEKIGNSTTQLTNATSTAQQNYMKTQANYTGRNASGTDYYAGGRSWVGEEGPEIVDLPRGSKIYNAKKSAQMVGAGTQNYYITIDAKNVQDFQRVVEMANSMQMATRRI